MNGRRDEDTFSEWILVVLIAALVAAIVFFLVTR